MRLSFFSGTRVRSRLPKKPLASFASWLVVVPLLSLTALASGAASASAAGNVYSFTNAGATGNTGPTQAQVNTAYSGTSLAGSVVINTQGIQEWTVPTTGSYQVKVVGAHGAASTGSPGWRGGRGAVIQGNITLTSGTKVLIVVGQAGTASSAHGGGGGASFVAIGSRASQVNPSNTIIAGGGGGTRQSAGTNGGDASVNQNGMTSPSSSNGTAGATYNNNTYALNSVTASLGYGGRAGEPSCFGDGGAGWVGDGFDDSSASTTAKMLTGAATGGVGGSANGGFGGGGSGQGCNGGGGGGGYTGGNGGFIAGGGGSYYSGFTSSLASLDTSRTFTSGGTPVHGYVTITSLNTPPSVSSFTSSQVTPTNISSDFTYTLTFSESVSGFEGSDLTNSGTSTGCSFSVSGSSGTTFTVTASGCGEGTLIPRVAANAVTNSNSDSGPPTATNSSTTITIDRTAPAAPSVPDLAAASDVGSSSTDNITTTGAKVFTGTAETGATIQLFVDGVSSGSTCVATGGSFSCTSGALTVGTRTITAVATDAAGNVSAASSALSIVVADLPGSPTSVTSTLTGSLSNSTEVSFTAPASDGGTAITGYTVTATPASGTAITATGTTSPITVYNLNWATTYTFTIVAQNAIGSSTPAANGGTQTPTKQPDAPTVGTATAASATSATVTFTAPANNGSTITSYTATSNPGGFTGTLSQAGSGTITVTGLNSDTSYTFTVTATNAKGTSAASAASNSIKTPTVAPTINSTTVGYQSLTVNASLSSGVRNTWFYRIEISSGTGCVDPDGVNATSSTSAASGSFTISGLTNGCAYSLSLANWNGIASDYTTTTVSICALGLCSSQPGKNAQEIKSTINTNTNGVYWILVNGVATQVYCIMDSAMDGGGWMLAMKGANTGSTFNYASNYWTTANTLNPTFLRRNDTNNEDAKFDVFNYTPAQKVMAIFPDATAGGAITGQSYGFVWNESMPTAANTSVYSGSATSANYYAKSLRELFSGGQKIYIRSPKAITPYRAQGSGIFSSQQGYNFFGFNYQANNSYKARFGFGWNNENAPDEGSNDVEGGIGLNYSGYSAGDYVYCCSDSSGAQRRMKFELYVKAVDAIPATLTYDGNSNTSGSAPSDSTSYIVGQSATVLGNTGSLVRDGYTFGGWADNSAGTGTLYAAGGTYSLPSATSILYAKWTANVYTVTYNYNSATGGNSTVSSTFTTGSGTPIVLPTPTRTSYTFAGWFSDAGLTTSIGAAGANYSPTGTTTTLNAYAKWNPNTYTITYSYNGADGGNSTTSSSFTTGGSGITLPTPTRTGYTLGSSAPAIFAGTLALHLDPESPSSYSGTGTTVTDLSGNGRNGTLAGSPLPSFSNTSPKSFNFQNTNSTSGNRINLTNKFLPDDLTIQTWIKTGSVGGGSQHYLNMAIMHAENGGGANDWGFGVNNTGKLAFGVGPNDVTIATDEAVNTNAWINVAVTRTKSTGEIRLYINGVLKKTGTGNSGNSLNAAGDTWIGNGQDGNVPFNGSIGQVLAYTSKLSDADIATNYQASCARYSLCAGTSGGWYSDASFTNFVGAAGSSYSPSGATTSITLYAQWLGNSNTVSFNSQGGSAVSSVTWVTGASLTLPAAPTLAGYSFNGWYTAATGGTRVGGAGASYTPSNTAGFTLYAQWSANSNTVLFDSQGGSAVTSQSWTTATSLTLPAAPTRAGYTFTGWYSAPSGGSPVAPMTVAANGLAFDGAGDISIPHANAFNFTTNITIEAWINTTSTSEQYITTKNEASFYLATNIAGNTGKAAFYLNGVNSGSGGGWLYSSASVNDGNWHHVAGTYDGTTIKIYVDGVLSGSRIVSSTILTRSDPIYIGSRGGSSNFVGKMYDIRYWNVARTAAEIGSAMNATLTGTESGLVAHYSLNQGSAGGTNTGLTSVTSSTGANNGTLNNFSLTGSSSNWIQVRAGSTYSPANTSGFTLYAQWTANTNTITFDSLGGSAVASRTFQTGGSLALPAAPTLANSTFLGWFLATSGGSALPSTYSPVATSDFTIYARWNTNRTLTINSSSYQAGYARSGTPPTLVATPSLGSNIGTITFTSATTSVCTVNSTTGVVAFIATGTCTISAAITEAGGFTAATSPSVSLAIRAVPGAPTGLAATPGNGQVTLSWSAPADTGGGVTSYIVTASPGGATCTWTSGPLSCSVAGLTNGTSYSFTVASVNAQGTSVASSAVVAIPRTVPGAPVITGVNQVGTGVARAIESTGLVLQYDVNSAYSGSGNVLVDAKGNSNATIVNAPAYVSSGGGYFNMVGGSSQYIITSTSLHSRFSTQANPSTTSMFMWVYPTATNGILISEFGGASIASGWHDSQIEMVNGTMRFRVWNGANLASSVATPINNWYYVGLVYDQAGQTLKGYVNGNLAVTGTGYARQTPWANGGTNLHFGIAAADSTNLGYGGYGNFRFGSLHVYNIALSQTQIQQNYEAGCARFSLCTTLGAVVDFTAPLAIGGSAITGYTVTSSSGATATGSASPITVTGLSLGIPYTFTVTATNAAGTSVPSAPSTSITLRGSPGAPTAPVPSLTVGGVSLVWAAPNANGGTISDYTIQYSADSGSTWTTFVDGTSPTTATTVRGLANGTAYIFRVAAISEQGTGSYSSSSASFTPASLPDAPGKPSGSSDGSSITIAWSASNANGSPISNYIISLSSDSGNTWTTVARSASTALSATVSSLTAGMTYLFRVLAVNALGSSPNSEVSNPIAVGTAPLAPTTLVATVDATTSTSAVLTWKKPTGGVGTVEAKPTIDATTFTAGLLGKRYVGYYNDNLNFFNTAPLFSGTGTPVNSTSIFNFSSNADYYSWQWVGFFKAPVTGVYRFYLSSDDASHLWIGDPAVSGYTSSNTVVNNGGLHPVVTRTGSINLIAGTMYPIRLMFGENGGGDVVSLFWDLPNGTRVTNGTGYFFQNPTGAVAAPVKGCAASVGNAGGVQISREGNNCVLKFTNPGVNSWTVPTGVTTADVLVVGGGGGAGFDAAGGGGGGAVAERLGQSVTAGNTFNVNVGAGGATSQSVGGQAQDGGSSTFGSITAVGGGGGGSKNANGRGVIGAGGGGGGHANPGSGGGITLGGVPSTGADSFWGWSASNASMVNNQGSVAQFSYIQASLTRTIALNTTVNTGVTFNVSVDNSINNIIGWVGERIDTYSIRVELLNSSGTVVAQQSFNGATKHNLEARTVTVPFTGAVASVRLTVTGFDAGYWAGFYGPIFRTPSLLVDGAQFPAPGSISGFGGGGASGSRRVGNGGGGGGAGGIGATSDTSAGGVGVLSTITNTFFGGGGGGGSWNSTGGLGGNGGGGKGGDGSGAICGNDGAPNTGGGGGAMGNAVCSNRALGAGGSGVVIVRYAAANANVELPPPSDYVVQYSLESPISWQTFDDGVSASESATVTNLEAGKKYIFRVASKNGVGVGSFTSASNILEVRGAPGVPAITSVTAGNQSAVVTFTAPTNIGGSPITRYTATATASGTPALTARTCTWNSGALTCTIGELVNGREYAVTLTATNAFGTSVASAGTTVTPKTTPAAPTSLTVTSGSAQLSLTWSAPTNTGGSVITGYRIERSTVAAPTWVVAIANTGSDATSATLTGLTNSTLYNIRVTALNSVGAGVISEVATGTPRGVPTAPAAPTGNGSAASAFITWSAPANNGAPITDYEIAFATSSTGPWTTFADDLTSATAATVTGLTNGAAHYFRIRAVNSVGNSEWSAASAAITPATRPDAPTLTSVAPVIGQPGKLAITFTAGATGGSPITGYEFSINGGATWIALTGTSNLSISDLTNGVSYTVQIRAVNAQGVSPASGSATGAPTAPADAPVVSGVVAGDSSLTVSFSAPANNGGSAITGYKYQIRGSSGTWSASVNIAGSPIVISSLNNAELYSVRVLAVNSGGDGAWSTIVQGTPFTTPSAPSISSITSGNGSLAIAHSVNSNGSSITALEYSIDGGANWIRSTTTTSPLTITGLTNGTPYTPQLRAVNAAGAGAAANGTATIPFTSPFAPAITSVTATATSLTLNFTINSGGNSVTNISYRIRSVAAPSNGTACAIAYSTLNWTDNWSAWTEVAATNSLLFDNLLTSNCYDIQIKARNAAGYGGVSRESGKPIAPPSAPAIVAVTPGASSLSVTFNESVDNGGSAITAYEYRIGSGVWTSLATLPGFTLGESTTFTLGSLTNGSSYAITLRGVNSAGAGAASSSVTGTPVTTPSAPTISAVTPLDGALQVAFTSPTSNGGSAILGYQYRLNSGAWITLPSSALISTFTISGLANGTPYQVSLRAFNGRGQGISNTFATNVGPGTTPDAPTISAVIVGNQQIALVVAPGLDGGYALDNYAYSINDGAWVNLTGPPTSALANPIVITGLTNGTTYRFKVRAVNFIGDSAASAEANGTPATTATAPSIVSISTNDSSLSVAFTAPSNNGGSTITSYEYSTNGGTTWVRRSSGGNTSPLVITGLTNGVAYNVKIRAINGIGAGLDSGALVGIPQIPGAGRPISLSTTALNGEVRIAWAPPAAYVGAPIVGYRVNATPGSGTCSWSSGEYNCTISGLTNGTSYTFTVTSLRDDNGTLRDIDTSVASATTTPRTLPGAPTAITAVGGGNEAALSWSAPANNGGAAITDYRIQYSSDAGTTWSEYSDAISAEPTTTVGGLLPGTQYIFRVAAINAAGVGSYSTASASSKTFEQAPELTLSLDQQSADGFSFILSFQDPILYTVAATTNNPSATVEQAGDFFTVRGLSPGASVTVTVTANRADYLQAVTTIFSSALMASTAPTVSTATSIDGGFRITVGNYAANTASGISYAVTTTAGAVIDDGGGNFRVVGLANGESAIATVTSSRPGYVTRTTSVSGTALFLGVAAQIENITGTRDGFTFTIANYSPEASYAITSSNTNAAISRVADVVTVSGLANLELATLTVNTVRTGYMDASTEVIGVALPQSEVNTLSAISLSSGAVAFDPATYEYTVNVANTVSSYRVTPTKSDVDSTITIAINGGATTSIASGAESAALPLNVGENTIVIAVTSQVGSIQNYTLYVKRAKSSIATLSALSFSSGSITGFTSTLNSYETTVPFLSSSVTATATPTSSAATMRIKVNSGSFITITSGVASGALNLNVGNNLVVVEVTAEDGTTVSTYEVTVTRSGAANSQLGSLVISVGTMATFNSSTLNYEVIVPNGTTSATVTPTLASSTTGSISVNGVDLADGAESQAITLTAGATTQITILVSASDGSSSTPYVVSVKVDAPPTALALTRQSVGTQSGALFTTQPQVSINDAQGNRVLLNTSTVSVAITSGSGGQLLGTTSVAALRGLATFADLGIRGVAGTTYTLTFSTAGLTVATEQITVTAGEAVALAFKAGSGTNASGATFPTPLQVAAVDGDGNTVTSFGSAITIAVGGNGLLGGSVIRTPAGGVATFTDATLRGTAGSTYTITATSSGLTSATRTVALTFGAPANLAISRATSGPVSALQFSTQPQLTIRDSAGNTVTNATGEVTVSIASGSGGTLGGNTTALIVNGIATFTDLSLSGTAGTAYTLAYVATGVTGATETLTLTPGAAARVQLITPAAGFNNGTAFTRAQPILRIQDSSGNLVTSSTASVTATVSVGGLLIGTTVQSASSGIVTFTNLGVFGTPGSAYTITYGSTGLTSATQTILLTSGSSLIPTFGSTTPTIDGFTVQITNFSRIFNWTFSLLEGSQNAQISLGSTGLLTVRGMEVGSTAIVSATTSRNGFENGAATITGSSLLAPLRPTFSPTTSTATGFRAQVSNFDSSYTWTISASNGGSALISSTGLITVTGLAAGVSSDITVTTTKTGRVSASASFTGTAVGADTTTATQDISANLLTNATLYPICAGGSSTNEGIGNLNDRNSKSKYLCFNASSKLNASYIRNSAGFYTGDLGTKVVTGIQFTSGDSDRSRDPIIYTLFGCNALNADCTPIVVNGRTGIDILRNDTAPVQAFFNTTPFNYYKVTFGALRTSWTDAAQVAEVALVGVDANSSARTPTFGAVTRTANGFTVPITNFDPAFTWRASVDNNGGVAIGVDGVVTVTGIAGGATATIAVTTSRPKYDNGAASISGVALNAPLIPTFGTATPTVDGFTVPITNYSADYTWSTSVASGTATIAAGVLTVAGQSSAEQALVTVTTARATYATGRAQVVATALADGLTPNFGPSISTADGFTIQVRNYSSAYTWSVSASTGSVTINSSGLITVTGLAAGTSATVTVGTSKSGSFTVISQTTGKAPIGAALTPRFALTVSTTDGFTAQILNYDAAYTWSGSAGVGQSVAISGTGLVTVTGVTVGRVATATITAARTGYVTGSQTISGTAVTPAVQTVGGSDIQLQVPVSASTSTTEVIVTIDIPVDAAPGSTTFTGSAVATDTVDQGLRTVKIGGTNGGSDVTTVSTPIAITIPASAGIGVPVYSPDGLNWIELPLLANPALPNGQDMGYYRYDDGTILILTRKIGE